jgi:DNA-directed RNA polymerase specialized sigma24 family protein
VTITFTRPMQNQLSPGSQMDDLQLQQLVQAIQASKDRQDRVVRKQVNQLLSEVSARIQPAKRYWISKSSGIPGIELIVAGAVNETLSVAIKKIDRYEPDKAQFMTWINAILKFKVLDAIEKEKKYRERHPSTDEPISADNLNSKAEAQLQAKIEQDENIKAEDLEREDLIAKLRQFINEDPEGFLTKKHIKDKPDATFQKILLMRLVPMTWQAIADSFDISSHGTINTFHDRQLSRYNSYFRKYLQQ